MKDEELSKNAIQHQLNEFDANLKERLSDSSFQVVIDPSIQYLEDKIAEADVWYQLKGKYPKLRWILMTQKLMIGFLGLK